MDQLLDRLMLSSGWELAALLLALAYLMLAAHQKQACWFAAAISCTLYAVIFADAKLYMEAFLQVFYVLMAGYGWWQWQYQVTDDDPATPRYAVSWHLLQWLWLLPLAGIVAWLLHSFTDAEAVVLDTYTTAFSLLATYLVTKKAFESWWYWLVIDSAYVYLYFSKGFIATALLFVLYVLLVVYAMYRWKIAQHKTTHASSAANPTG